MDISTEEWQIAASLVDYTTGDEYDILGMILLTCDGEQRRWWAADAARIVTDAGAADDRVYEVLVSIRTVAFGAQASEATGSARLTIVADETAGLTVAVGNEVASLLVSGDPRHYPDVRAANFPTDPPECATVVIDATTLRDVMVHASRRATNDDDDNPLLLLELDEGTLRLDVAWPGLGTTRYTATGTGHGAASTAAPPRTLAAALRDFHGEVVVSMPIDRPDQVRMEAGGRIAAVLPVTTGIEAARPGVEEILTNVFGADILVRDHDGDYLLSDHGTPIYARLWHDTLPTLQVFGIVLSDVENTPELLAELNDHNARIYFARSFWSDGQVLVESDLVAATLDPEELVTAFKFVRGIADDFGPLLAAVHGGTLVARPVEAVWDAYLHTIITADHGPGIAITLTGPDAVEQWPYGDDPVHVLTAASPYGRARSVEANRDANAELAKLLIRQGASFVRAVGTDHDPAADADAPYVEPGYLIWGIDRSLALEFGRYFDQEAIFEIDADEVRVLGCDEDRVQSLPRLPPDRPTPPD